MLRCRAKCLLSWHYEGKNSARLHLPVENGPCFWHHTFLPWLSYLTVPFLLIVLCLLLQFHFLICLLPLWIVQLENISMKLFLQLFARAHNKDKRRRMPPPKNIQRKRARIKRKKEKSTKPRQTHRMTTIAPRREVMSTVVSRRRQMEKK